MSRELPNLVRSTVLFLGVVLYSAVAPAAGALNSGHGDCAAHCASAAPSIRTSAPNEADSSSAGSCSHCSAAAGDHSPAHATAGHAAPQAIRAMASRQLLDAGPSGSCARACQLRGKPAAPPADIPLGLASPIPPELRATVPDAAKLRPSVGERLPDPFISGNFHTRSLPLPEYPPED